ncbi:MAG: hypothetical protein LBP62_06385 [Clostridiales bacterium]|nr:hypothetical protein [Clostridiales bacterium]
MLVPKRSPHPYPSHGGEFSLCPFLIKFLAFSQTVAPPPNPLPRRGIFPIFAFGVEFLISFYADA